MIHGCFVNCKKSLVVEEVVAQDMNYFSIEIKAANDLDLGSGQKMRIMQLSNKGLGYNSYLVQAYRLLRSE